MSKRGVVLTSLTSALVGLAGCGDSGEACPVVDRRPIAELAFFDDPATLEALQGMVPASYTSTATYRGTGETAAIDVAIEVDWSGGYLAVVEPNDEYLMLCSPGFVAFPATFELATDDGVLDLRGASELTFGASRESMNDPSTPRPESLQLFGPEIPVDRVGPEYPRRVGDLEVLSAVPGLDYPRQGAPSGTVTPVVAAGPEAVAIGPAGGRSTLSWGASTE